MVLISLPVRDCIHLNVWLPMSSEENWALNKWIEAAWLQELSWSEGCCVWVCICVRMWYGWRRGKVSSWVFCLLLAFDPLLERTCAERLKATASVCNPLSITSWDVPPPVWWYTDHHHHHHMIQSTKKPLKYSLIALTFFMNVIKCSALLILPGTASCINSAGRPGTVIITEETWWGGSKGKGKPYE